MVVRIFSALLLLLLVGCKEDAEPVPNTKHDAGSVDTGTSTPTVDAGTIEDAGSTTDSGIDPGALGETCHNPIVLAWAGSKLDRHDDSRDFRQDYTFVDCVQDQYWIYLNRDVVYRLDLPPGDYQATLKPDNPNSYLSIIDIRGGACDAFESSCTTLVDSDHRGTTIGYSFSVTDGELIHFVVDSYGNPDVCQDGIMCTGGYTLSITKPELLAGLGETCNNSFDCAGELACFIKDYTPPGYCSTFCTGPSDCAGSVAMECADLGSVHFPAYTQACIKTDEQRNLPEYAQCEYSFSCTTGFCSSTNSFPSGEGECRTVCTNTCSGDTTCVDITENLYKPPEPLEQISVCAANSDLHTRALADDCDYSYQCAQDHYCDWDFCVVR